MVHRTACLFRKTTRFVTFRYLGEISAVFNGNHTKQINTMFEHNVEIFHRFREILRESCFMSLRPSVVPHGTPSLPVEVFA